jgi:hypothetical protein
MGALIGLTVQLIMLLVGLMITLIVWMVRLSIMLVVAIAGLISPSKQR